MRLLKRSSDQSRRNVRPMTLLCLAAILASGCATVEQPLSNDDPAAWASRIQSLPVDVHGAIPGQTSAQTMAAMGVTGRVGAAFQNNGVSLYAMPRVVVYVGDSSVPARDQYCELKPTLNPAAFIPKSGVVVRSALCDGPRPVAYARMILAEANPSPATVAQAIERLKSDLWLSLPRPPEFGN